MTQTKAEPIIRWEKLPEEFQLPDEPVDDLYHPLLAAILREILELAGFITNSMLIASNFGLCANVDGKTVVKAPDWFYVPILFSYQNLPKADSGSLMQAALAARGYLPRHGRRPRCANAEIYHERR